MTHFLISTPTSIPSERLKRQSQILNACEYIKCLAFDDRLLPNERGQSHVTRFLNFAPVISLESVKLCNSNFV